MAIIHLGLPLPTGSSDLPGNAASPFGLDSKRAAYILRFPIWSCTTRSLPGRRCYHRRRWALTSPFHPLPLARLEYSLLHLSSSAISGRPDVIRLAALWCSDFPRLLSQPRLPSVLRI